MGTLITQETHMYNERFIEKSWTDIDYNIID